MQGLYRLQKGGERQILSGSWAGFNERLPTLLLDEFSLRLAPIMLKPILLPNFITIKAISQAGVIVLLVEQMALRVAHRGFVLGAENVGMVYCPEFAE